MRTTVLVPLHRSERWLPVVAANIERLHAHCRIIVSDVDEADDSLATLRQRFAAVSSVSFLGSRPIARGWVAHCNELMARPRTPFAMWLPHDDSIELDWVRDAERTLDARRDAIAACGRLVPSPASEPGMSASLDPDPGLGSRCRLTRLARGVAHIEHGDPALLGMLFRSVVRSDRVPPLPATDAGGSWSDIYWALRLLGRGAVVTTGAEYAKAWHRSSAVQQWHDARHDRAQLRRDIDRVLAEIPLIERLLAHRFARRRG